MANEVLDQLWVEIEENWVTLKQLLMERLPYHDERMFNDSGDWVDSNRPMIESIVSDKVARSPRLFYYLCAIGVIQPPEALSKIEENSDGSRIIHINAFAGMGFQTGGKQQVDRKT